MPNIDGINKIKKGDVKKSRNIVLSAIKKHDDEVEINGTGNGSKKKIVNVDAVRKNVKKEPLKKVMTEELIKPIKNNEEKTKKSLPQLVKKNIDGLEKSSKKEPVIKSKEQKIKKISKEKRDVWLSEMKGVFDAGEKEVKEVKEDEYKIKKVVKQVTKKLETISPELKKEQISRKSKMFSKEFFKKDPKVITKPESREIKKIIPQKKKPETSKKLEAKKRFEKKDFKEASRTEDFEFDLTPALSKKRHEMEKQKTQAEKSIKKSFFRKKKEKKKEIKKKRKEKLILEKKERKKKIQEKKDELEKTKTKSKLEKKKKEHKRKEHKALEREQRRMKRREKIIALRFNMKENSVRFFSSCKTSLRFVPLLFLMVFSTALFCYLIFFTLLVKLDFDLSFFRKVANVFPVPVIISDNGVIEYFKYKDLRQEFYDSNKDLVSSDFKVFLIRKMIISDLAFEYNIDLKNLTDEGLFNEVEGKIIFDNNVNQVAINRIRKISQLVMDGEDFMKIASKYGDAQGHISIGVESNNKFNDFKTDLSTLKKGEISRIEYTKDGYYIFQSMNDVDDNSYLNYVYIKSKTLNEYIKEEIVLYRLWSFVD